MNVLFSIKPQYAKRIFDGTKNMNFEGFVASNPLKRCIYM